MKYLKTYEAIDWNEEWEDEPEYSESTHLDTYSDAELADHGWTRDDVNYFRDEILELNKCWKNTHRDMRVEFLNKWSGISRKEAYEIDPDDGDIGGYPLELLDENLIDHIRKYCKSVEKNKFNAEKEAKEIYNRFWDESDCNYDEEPEDLIDKSEYILDHMRDIYADNYTDDQWDEIEDILKIDYLINLD
jgi:hypothetical protein